MKAVVKVCSAAGLFYLAYGVWFSRLDLAGTAVLGSLLFLSAIVVLAEAFSLTEVGHD